MMSSLAAQPPDGRDHQDAGKGRSHQPYGIGAPQPCQSIHAHKTLGVKERPLPRDASIGDLLRAQRYRAIWETGNLRISNTAIGRSACRSQSLPPACHSCRALLGGRDKPVDASTLTIGDRHTLQLASHPARGRWARPTVRRGPSTERSQEQKVL